MIKDTLHRWGRNVFWRNPVLYVPIAIVRGRKNPLANDYDFFIEGFPRSANTFAQKAFILANPNVKLCSHCHLPPHVIQAVRVGKPGFLLLRQPVDCVTSWAIYTGDPVRRCLNYYLDFHSVLRNYRHDLVVASFEEVTSEFGNVIDCVNRRFGTAYKHFEHTESNLAKCNEQIDIDYRSKSGRIREMQVCRPSIHRVPLKTELVQEYHRLENRPDVLRAQRLYESFLEMVDPRTPQRARVESPIPSAIPDNSESITARS